MNTSHWEYVKKKVLWRLLINISQFDWWVETRIQGGQTTMLETSEYSQEKSLKQLVLLQKVTPNCWVFDPHWHYES